MIVIVDYGMGNLRSVSKAFQTQGYDVCVTSDKKEIENSKGLVLPGVGSFGACIRNLQKLELTDLIVAHIESGKPFLGICLGLQILFQGSEESAGYPGLGIFKGKAVRFPHSKELKVPHMGWNQIRYEKRPTILEGIENGSWFYFVHSYYVVPTENNINIVSSDYGFSFAAAVEKENVFACQFHPEKSATVGLQLIKNFAVRCLEYD